MKFQSCCSSSSSGRCVVNFGWAEKTRTWCRQCWVKSQPAFWMIRWILDVTWTIGSGILDDQMNPGCDLDYWTRDSGWSDKCWMWLGQLDQWFWMNPGWDLILDRWFWMIRWILDVTWTIGSVVLAGLVPPILGAIFLDDNRNGLLLLDPLRNVLKIVSFLFVFNLNLGKCWSWILKIGF